MTRARMEEYRRKAQECLELARKISLERERAIVLEIAQSWLRLAEQQETLQPPLTEQPQQPQQRRALLRPSDRPTFAATDSPDPSQILAMETIAFELQRCFMAFAILFPEQVRQPPRRARAWSLTNSVGRQRSSRRETR
jgi:hypothetical protein